MPGLAFSNTASLGLRRPRGDAAICPHELLVRPRTERRGRHGGHGTEGLHADGHSGEAAGGCNRWPVGLRVRSDNGRCRQVAASCPSAATAATAHLGHVVQHRAQAGGRLSGDHGRKEATCTGTRATRANKTPKVRRHCDGEVGAHNSAERRERRLHIPRDCTGVQGHKPPTRRCVCSPNGQRYRQLRMHTWWRRRGSSAPGRSIAPT